ISTSEAAAIQVPAVLGGAEGWDPRRVPAHISAVKVTGAALPPPPGLAVQTSPQVIPLWPEGVPDAKPNAGEERNVDDRISNVQVPTLTYHAAPAGISVGTAVIVCPG